MPSLAVRSRSIKILGMFHHHKKGINRSVFSTLLSLFAFSASCYASVSEWTENAENGNGSVLDYTDAGYPLIQGERFADGAAAFHLANPEFSDNWFELDVDVDVAADTKLFFLSCLQAATQYQVAKVQISLDGGASWPDTAYSQAGVGFYGESEFALREVDLGAAYASQQVRIRFYYDFISTSAYTSVDVGYGWLVDRIQIGATYDQQLWNIGDPAADAVLYLEYINRSRADAMVEANRLKNTTDLEIIGAYNYFGVDVNDIVTQFQWNVDNDCMDLVAQPLAFHSNLLDAAQKHTEDMFNNDFQGHVSSSNPVSPIQPGDTLPQRLSRVGYTGYSLAGENVFARAESVEYGHAGFEVDWGSYEDASDDCYNAAFEGQGMQNPAGHRLGLHDNDYNEIGIGVVNDRNGSVGPQLVTQDFGSRAGISYITGVIYDDLDENGFYSADEIGHEGRSGVRVDVEGSPYYAISSTAGAYAIPVLEDGTYTVTFSGSDMETFVTTVTISGGLNTKLDHDPMDALEPSPSDAVSFADWATENSLTGVESDDADGDSVDDLIEYAIEGMDPNVMDAANFPGLTLDEDGKRRLTVNKRSIATGISYEVLVSDDLSTWDSVADFTGASIEVDNADQLIVAIDGSVATAFVCLKVTQLP